MFSESAWPFDSAVIKCQAFGNQFYSNSSLNVEKTSLFSIYQNLTMDLLRVSALFEAFSDLHTTQLHLIPPFSSFMAFNLQPCCITFHSVLYRITCLLAWFFSIKFVNSLEVGRLFLLCSSLYSFLLSIPRMVRIIGTQQLFN